MIEILIRDGLVLLKYTPSSEDTVWIDDKFKNTGDFTVKEIFVFKEKHQYLLPNVDDSVSKVFLLGNLNGDYYQIISEVLQTEADVQIHKSVELTPKIFHVERVSVFKKLEKLARQPIIIGGEHENSIPSDVFKDLLNSFPTKREYHYYTDSQIEGVISQYLDGVKESQKLYENYLNKRRKIVSPDQISALKEQEKIKYEYILSLLKKMLKDSDKYSENDWQNKILDIILILYPKYIRAFRSAPVNDYYFNPAKPTKRQIDIMLVDANGCVDIIEIKKPFTDCLVTKRNNYRDNHTPLKELSGTVMQTEKYIFHLTKSGRDGEKALNKKYKSELPPNVEINVTKPKGIVVMGRSDSLNPRQLFDFEIIKRKYSNIIDIITYDDLIQRLENILSKFS